MLKTILAISIGSSFGAVFRWFLGVKLNPLYESIPLGTLGANLIGGYLVGFFVAFFAQNSHLSPEWRVLVITGFLGGLTTFSTFSAEIVSILQNAKYSTALIGICLHLGGSLLMTVAGIATFWLLAKFFV